MTVSLRSLSLLALAGAGSLLFSGCYDEPYYGRAAYYDRPAYYDGPRYSDGPGYYSDAGPYDAGYYDEGPGVDFYYVGERPYSRAYGPLLYRDGGYYYRHGGGYVIYDRGGRGRARGDYRHSREVVAGQGVRNYSTTSARYRGANVYPGGTYPGTTSYRGTTRGTYPAGGYPNGGYAGRTTVRGNYGATVQAPAGTRAQVHTRSRAQTTTSKKQGD